MSETRNPAAGDGRAPESFCLAAERGEALTVIPHWKRVAGVTREAFLIVKVLGESEASDA